MTKKDLLLHLTNISFDGTNNSLLIGIRPTMWVPPDRTMPDLENYLTEEQAKKRPDCWHRSVFEILHHVADYKAKFIIQAFGPPEKPLPQVGRTLESAVAYLEAAHEYVVECLERIPEEDLDKPVRTECHGETAAILFSVLAQHDAKHGGEIQVLRNYLK